MNDPADAGMAKLHVMAAVLGIPIESFFDEHEEVGRLFESSECLRLWDKIKTADGRRRALECLRELADAAET